MSQRRVVYVKTTIRVRDRGSLEIKLSEQFKGFLSKEEINNSLEKILEQDGWEKEGKVIVKKEDEGLKIVYDPEKGKLTVEMDVKQKEMIRSGDLEDGKKKAEEKVRKSVSSVIDLFLETYKKKFREEYIPELVKRAIEKKAKEIDPEAKIISEKNDKDSLSITISLEV